MIIKFFRHVYWALRYGEWTADWEMYKDKPMLNVNYVYYDGHHVTFHCYKLWICVSY